MFETVKLAVASPGRVSRVPPRSRQPQDPDRPARSPRRPRVQLSQEQIVDTAIWLLDRGGAKGLTLRSLATELGGGLGSIYWYVQGKDEVVGLACDALVQHALDLAEAQRGAPYDGPELGVAPVEVVAAVAEVRRHALALFHQTQRHPWLAAQLQVRGAGGGASLRYWEALGRPLARMGLTMRQQFNGSTAISGYVTGVAAEMSAQDGIADTSRSKDEQLGEIVDGWLAADPKEFAWIQSVAEEFRTHDDDEQFTAGLDLLLGGLVRQALGTD